MLEQHEKFLGAVVGVGVLIGAAFWAGIIFEQHRSSLAARIVSGSAASSDASKVASSTYVAPTVAVFGRVTGVTNTGFTLILPNGTTQAVELNSSTIIHASGTTTSQAVASDIAVGDEASVLGTITAGNSMVAQSIRISQPPPSASKRALPASSASSTPGALR